MKVSIQRFLKLNIWLLLLVPLLGKAAQDIERIVVSGGSITEIIYAFNEQQRIVGVDSTSVFPSDATNKPQVGYVRRINVEGILSLNPELLLGEADTGPEKVLKQLQNTGLTTHIFSEDDNLAGVENKIKKVAQLLNVEEKGQQLVSHIAKIEMPYRTYYRK